MLIRLVKFLQAGGDTLHPETVPDCDVNLERHPNGFGLSVPGIPREVKRVSARLVGCLREVFLMLTWCPIKKSWASF